MDAARAELPGLSVRYEDLVQEPERVTREICAHLDVPWEAEMLRYGAQDHGPLVPRLGDWSAKLKSGAIDANLILPTAAEIPTELREECRAWGYLT
jgi:hypothetical protein